MNRPKSQVRARFAALLGLALSICAAATAAPSDWRLIWQDDFNGTALNPNCWAPLKDQLYNNQYELQNFTPRPENVQVSDGMLKIIARKERNDARGRLVDYTSAQISSQYLAAWTYGRFESRIKFPQGNGLWPVFWLYPNNKDYGFHPRSGEIDIAEAIMREPRRLTSVIHYGGFGKRQKHTVQFGELNHTEELWKSFHVYAAEWRPNSIKFFFNGKQFHEARDWAPPPGAKKGAPFDKPFHFFLTLAIGGDWAGKPDETTPFPAVMEFDYVRVWEDANAPWVKAREAALARRMKQRSQPVKPPTPMTCS
jgi:beta-glucanase (GH16 family)